MANSDEETLRFIAASFTSIWALELLLLLKRMGGACTRRELVNRLSASELVVTRAIDSLVAAGLLSDEADTAIYQPASRSVSAIVERAEELYLRRPDAVRRTIINARSVAARAFSDAFRVRKDGDD
jgi:predicted transcriptional regulator